MIKLNCVIIDDEPLALELMESYVNQTPFLNLVKCCSSASEFIELINKESVDLVFMDIHMPDVNGLELSKIIDKNIMVIFVTAYDQYAVESYKVNAVDYLLKPISFPRFVQAVNKVQERIQLLRSKECETKPEKDYFMVKADYKLYRIDFVNILFVEGQSEYVTFHLKDNKKITAYYALKKLEEELPSRDFMRIHKSYIVSLANIESVEGNLVTIAGQKLSIGKNYKDLLMDRLNC